MIYRNVYKFEKFKQIGQLGIKDARPSVGRYCFECMILLFLVTSEIATETADPLVRCFYDLHFQKPRKVLQIFFFTCLGE